MMKPNLVLNLPGGFYQDVRFERYIAGFEQRYNCRRTDHHTADAFKEDLLWADAILTWAFPEFTEQDLKPATRLRYIGQLNSTRTTAEAALKCRVQLSDMRSCYSLSVAEFAMAHIMNVYREVGVINAQMHSGHEYWIRDTPFDIPSSSRELTGTKVGLVGFGGIGQHLTRMLAPFYCEISASDPFVSQDQMAEHGVKAASLDVLCKQCQIVVLCAANNNGTKHLIGRQQIESMQPDALLVNVGRAHLVDGEALLERARKGDMSFATDVFDMEPLPQDSPLRKLGNVYMTPHRGATVQSFYRIFDNFTQDLEGVLEYGKPTQWPVPYKDLHCLCDYK